jgi:signal transduction histidine kinase
LAATTELVLLRRAQAMAGIGAWQCGPGGADLCWSQPCWALLGLPSGTPQPSWHAALALLAPVSAQLLQNAVLAVQQPGATVRSFNLQLHLQGDAAAPALRCTGQAVNDDGACWVVGHWHAPMASNLGATATLRTGANQTQPSPAGDGIKTHLPGPSPAVPLSAQEAWRILDIAANQVGFGFGYREADGDRAQWSDPLKALFDLPPSAHAPTRQQLLAMLDPADREAVNDSLLNPPLPGELREFEFRLLPNAKGLQRTLLTRGAVLPTDSPGSRLYFAVIDITQLRARGRERALELHQLHQRLQLATEAAGIGTWEWDTVAGVAKWDAITIALFGLQELAEQRAGQGGLTLDDFYTRIHPSDREALAQRLANTSNGSTGFDPLVRVQLPGGQLRWVQTRGRREVDSSGKVTRRLGVCFDVTERQEAQANRQATAVAEQANAAKTTFLSRMSHELRTPLNAVLGFAQLLTLDTTTPLTDTQRTRVTHIQQAGWHLLSMINDVLDLTHLEAHESPLTLAAVPVHEALQTCLDTVAAQRQRSVDAGVSETAASAPGPASAGYWQTVQLLNRCLPQNANLTVRADAARLAQALVNVVAFLAKRTGLGGTVEISAVACDGDKVSLHVRDDGPPLTAQEMQLLFEPFSRLGPDMPVADSTGVGLTLSKLIVEQMGGQVRVSSGPLRSGGAAAMGGTGGAGEPGGSAGGTLFELLLPSGS